MTMVIFPDRSELNEYFNENRELIATINDITKTFISKSE